MCRHERSVSKCDISWLSAPSCRKGKGDMGSCGCDPGQRSVVDVVTKYNDGVPKGVAVQQTVTWTPNQVPRLIGHHATDPLWWRARSAAETVAGQIVSVEYDGIEYRELPVNCSVMMLSHNISHPPWRVGHAGQASESRRQPVLAVALGARSAWSMATGGGCVASRARVDHTCVRAACRRETEARTCRSLARWPIPRTCGTTLSWCPRR